MNPDWQDRARCVEVGGDFFFPEPGGSTLPAKSICAQCEVRAECLVDALVRDEGDGVRGGLSPRERAKLAKDLAAKGKRPQPMCGQCGVVAVPRSTVGTSTTYCPDCIKYRARASHVRHEAIRTTTAPTDIHRWQSRPRPTLGRTSEGYGGAA
jgi:WhiB family redox-sensing transcriptional regulator